MRLAVTTAVLLSLLLCLSCDEQGGAVEIEQTHQSIIGGTADSGHPAVGAVVMNYFLCSGTLIAPKIVVTAAHCVLPNDPPKQFGLGPKTSSATEILNVVQAIPHPQYGQGNVDGWTVNVHDIAILVLDKAAQAQPMKYRTESIDGLTGAPVTFVGFGVTVPGNPTTTGTKMKVAGTIGKVAAQGFFNYTSPANPKNTCTGDSGGPAVYSNGGVDEVISGVSGGDEACAENGFNTRVDAHAAWIQQLIQQHDPQGVAECGNGVCEAGENTNTCPADCVGRGGCGGISFQGCCEGEVLKWCENDAPSQADCTAAGKPSCGWNASSNFYDCGTDGGADPSGQHPKACGAGEAVCGNGTCEGGETAVGCPQDCGEEIVCGNGLCEWGEGPEACPEDCAPTTQCGDGKCEGSETSDSCPDDCVINTAQCGDGECEAPETSESCPADCDITTACGDGECGPGESQESCSEDCSPTCGDGECNGGETCFTCPSDCGGCEEEGGGGCNAGPRAAKPWWLFLVLILVLRRQGRERARR